MFNYKVLGKHFTKTHGRDLEEILALTNVPDSVGAIPA